MVGRSSLFVMNLLFFIVVSIISQDSSYAFTLPPSHHQGTHHHATSPSCLYSSRIAKDNDQHHQHSHSLLWEKTLEVCPDSYANPAIELTVRPPDEGGTGILAVQDVPKDTVVLNLPLEQVGMIDVASILDAAPEGEDAVLDKLSLMWKEEELQQHQNNEEQAGDDRQDDDDGRRLAVLVGIIAHLQLTRYKDKTASTAHLVKDGHALEQSRRLGLFLDAMPLLPQRSSPNDTNNPLPRHPFPTHFLYWDDDEIEHLLQGTIAQTNARQLRGGVGLLVREWSAAFLEEHSTATGIKQVEILNAIFSAFTAVLSRSFGDAAGRALGGAGRMLVPLVDMLNHDSEEPNVSWTWHVGEGDEELIKAGRGNVSVTTLKEVKRGEELYKCYGWGPAWDIASNYGFVPRLKKERWECSAIPLFPAVLGLLAPDVIATPNQIAKDETLLDLLLESNYGNLVKAVQSAVDAANEIESRQTSSGSVDSTEDKTGRPAQLDRLEIVSLFRPPPALTANNFPFARRQPCVVVGTRIGISDHITSTSRRCHQEAIKKVLPAYRAAASVIAQLRQNYVNGDQLSSIEASQISIAAASTDKGTDWDKAAFQLMRLGIDDRIQTIERDGKSATAWLGQFTTGNRQDKDSIQHRQFRYEMSLEVREAELNVLRTLDNELKAEEDKD
mmetsp:Transcript_6309/g.9864  ORF Transcript_6309/g.9864 Transcript_6309/m.9864 type:complete len:670 (-) Transcript_6309:227-2236(-)